MEPFQIQQDHEKRLRALENVVRRLTGQAALPSFTGDAGDLSGTILAENMPGLTGDVTSSAGSVATTIANDAVTNAKAANMAQATIKGRAAGAGTGDPTDLTSAQATAILDVMVGDSGAGGTKGLAPAPAAGDAAAGKFLKANGNYEVPAGGSIVTLLTADPASPSDDTWWAVREGATPTEVSIKARIGGATYLVAALTLP